MIVAMAWRNLWRQPVRTGLSLLSMAFASAILVFMLSFQLGVYGTMKANALRLFDGFAQIQPAGYADDPGLRKTIDDPGRVAARATAVPGIGAAAPRATAYAILASGQKSFGAAVYGVDPGAEPRVSTLPATVRKGRYLRDGDAAEIVLGETLARNLGVGLGDDVTVLGSARDGTVAADSLKVVGMFHTGLSDLDRRIAQMPLARFQETFAMDGRVNVIALSGADLAAVDAALPRLRRAIGGSSLTIEDWGALEPGLKQAITLDFSSSMLWYVSLVVVVVFIILNTLLMSVLERTREFGMLMAVGMRPHRIGRMLWLELIFLALLGNAAGIAIGGGTALFFQMHGMAFSGLEGLFAQWGLPGRLYPALTLTSALAGPLVIVASVALAGLIPYRRILRMEPVAAMGSA